MFSVHVHAQLRVREQRLPSLKKQLGEAKIQSLAEVFELQTYAAGEIVNSADKAADLLFVIKTGCCILAQVSPWDERSMGGLGCGP